VRDLIHQRWSFLAYYPSRIWLWTTFVKRHSVCGVVAMVV
jgi:hypothetical protein